VLSVHAIYHYSRMVPRRQASISIAEEQETSMQHASGTDSLPPDAIDCCEGDGRVY